jgi:hypothetical protein
VKVWSYTDRKFVGLRGADLVLTTVKGIVAEGKRDTDNANIRRALRGRAAAHLATGARRFGFRSVPIGGGAPNRNGHAPKRWVIDEEQAAVIRTVGEAFVSTAGYRAAAMRLNEAGVPSTTGRTWSHASVRNILLSPFYRGVVVYGRKRTVHRRGTGVSEQAPDEEVLRIDHPELRIWPSELLARIDALLAQVRSRTWPAAAAGVPGGARRLRRHLGSRLIRCTLWGRPSRYLAPTADTGPTSARATCSMVVTRALA